MIWIIHICFLLGLTCLTGSICMTVWLAAASQLQKRGNARVIYRLLKLVMWGYTMPLVYLAFFGWNNFTTSEGWVLITTPRMDMILQVCFVLWLTGTVVYALFQIPMLRQFKYIRGSRFYARVEKTALMDRLKKELGIRKNIVLYQGYIVISPFIYGFRRTEIYLPMVTLSDRELEIVLRHELTHYKQHDTFWKPAFAIVNGLFWFNPLVWIVSSKMQRWAEASCDEACCQNGLTAKEYFSAIYNMATSEAWRPSTYSPLWAETGNELLWRVQCASKTPKDQNAKSGIARVAATAIMIGSCILVGATTISASDMYDKLYRQTREDIEEPLLKDGMIEHTGTVDELFANLTVEEISDMESGAINWTIDSMKVKETAYFYKKDGATIIVAGFVESNNLTVQIGIIEPDNQLRYIYVNGMYSYTFKLTKDGLYKVYVENPDKATVTIFCSYE